jgi:HD-GYP domain-containing protein (c-di-GMP phosphodiesterase class II)
MSTLEALIASLDAREHETQNHSRRVQMYTVGIARAVGIPEDRLGDVARGALLHDIGKIGVSDNILLKPGKLTPEEWVEMRRHPEIGYQILKSIAYFDGATRVVRYHHERWDGNGYPYGLKTDEIPIEARVFMVADTFDAMTSDRVYRRALPLDLAIEELSRHSGTQFDPAVVKCFVDNIDHIVREVSPELLLVGV